MTPFGDTGRRRLVVIGLLAAPLALAGWVGAGIAQGAGVPAPSMEVHPTTDLQYGQTVEIRAHHLPKGSGLVTATICGLQDTAGATIANPSPGDCASTSAFPTLVVQKAWQPDGEFGTEYSLPASSETFGANHRACDHAHRCALVVADANASAPVYRLVTAIFFTDQAFVPLPASTATRVASGAVQGSANAASAWTPAVVGATTNIFATTGNATTTTSVGDAGSTTPESALSTPSSSGRARTRAESTAAAAGGPGSSQNPNGAGSTGGTTSGTVSGPSAGSGQGDVSGSGGGPGPSVGTGGGTSGGDPGPTSPPTTAPPLPVTVPPTLPPVTLPPVTLPPVTLPPATVPTLPPPPSDPVCTDLSVVVQLVGGDPSSLLGDCNAPSVPAAPPSGIVGPLLGRH